MCKLSPNAAAFMARYASKINAAVKSRHTTKAKRMAAGRDWLACRQANASWGSGVLSD